MTYKTLLQIIYLYFKQKCVILTQNISHICIICMHGLVIKKSIEIHQHHYQNMSARYQIWWQLHSTGFSFVFWTNRLGDKLMIFSTSLYYNILRAWCCTEMLLNKIITIYQHRYQRMSARYHIRHLSHYIELFPFGMKQNIYETQSYCLIFSYHCWNSKYPVHRLIVGSI